MTIDDIKKAVVEAQKPLVERVDKLAQQRTWLLVITALSLIIAAVSILYGINREQAFQDQLTTNRTVVCGTVKSTALAPRKEPVAGESRDHYLNRLEAQREQLLAVGDLECPTLPGFATFPVLRARALLEIETILRRLAPEKLRQALGTSAPSTQSNPAIAETPSPTTVTAPAGAPTKPSTGHAGGHEHPQHEPSSPPGGGKGTGGGDDESGAEGPSGEPPPEETTTSNPPATSPPPEEEPTATAKPGVLDPVLNTVCEVTHGIQLCSPR